MKSNILKILVGIILVLLVAFIIYKLNPEDESFNKVQLSYNNHIYNEKYDTYYDTVLNVAMDQMGLSGYNVIVLELSDKAKSQFDGELKAHIRYENGEFYLFTQSMGRKQAIEVLCHEVIHIQQYVSKDLIYYNGNVIWKGETIELNSKEYESRPWENDAFARQTELINYVNKVLYLDDK